MSMTEILFSSHNLLEVVEGVHESEHSIKINYSPVLLLSNFFCLKLIKSHLALAIGKRFSG